eukprot:359106-Chlamydomonas_euryale.AAC.1
MSGEDSDGDPGARGDRAPGYTVHCAHGETQLQAWAGKDSHGGAGPRRGGAHIATPGGSPCSCPRPPASPSKKPVVAHRRSHPRRPHKP